MTALKIILMLVILVVLAYPLLPLRSRAKRFSTIVGISYDKPHNRKNFPYLLLVIVEIVLFALLFSLWNDFSTWLVSLPFLGSLFEKVPEGLQFSTAVVFGVIFFNLLMLYLYVFVGGLLKRSILDPIWGLEQKKEKKAKKKKKKGSEGEDPDPEDPTDDTDDAEDEAEDERIDKLRKKFRIPFFRHKDDASPDDTPTDDTKDPTPRAEDTVPKLPDKDKHPILYAMVSAIYGLFFEGEDYRYARKWTMRVRAVLQLFVYVTEVLYFIEFIGLLCALFFECPDWLYNILNYLVNKMYIYPFLSLILLQVVCNYLDAQIRPVEEVDSPTKDDEIVKKESEARLNALQSELLGRFATEHCIRLYPETDVGDKSEYVCTNKTYAGALSYIRNHMKASSGHVVQSYMKGMDALFNGEHLYFSSSFYSELGEYLVAYTYIRLLAGQRQIFVVSDRSKVDSLKKYIGRRLSRLTGTSDEATWRVRSANERLDQADVLIAVPEDFRDDNMIEHFPGFFEEVCNAIFIDADRTATLDTYLCTVMAIRLQRATDNRIRFIFVTKSVLQGFAGSLKKLFTIREDIAECSSAEENESVAYWLWNRESSRIYEKSGQKLTSLECIIAEEASEYGVDGIRIMTSAPFDATDKRILAEHRVEFNEFHKDVPVVNYLVYNDDRCNLPSALYTYTRFHGKTASVVHILSKPYLLREYFMARIEHYVNHSSFIQPRIPENVDSRKLSLLRIFCDATSEEGLTVTQFTEAINKSIKQHLSGSAPCLSPFCKKFEDRMAQDDSYSMTLDECAAYLLAGLTDKKGAPAEESLGNNPTDYYILTNPVKQDHFSLSKAEFIRFNRVKDIFDLMIEDHERVELRLDDHSIGYLDTFPSRVYQQYIPGQSLLFDNKEYEIDHISADRRVIYLRQENITLKNCLDTIHLRRFTLKGVGKAIGNEGAVHFSEGPLSAIKMHLLPAEIVGETYGFYSLMTDSQSLDFVSGVRGNPHLDESIVKGQTRTYGDGRMLSIALTCADEATDEMRLLLSAVFNEYIRTLYPDVCSCIAVCPVLESPCARISPKDGVTEQVKTLYPYIVGDAEHDASAENYVKETSKNTIRLLVINDCEEDVGVLDKIFDNNARIFYELLTHIYGYLHWLQNNPTLPEGQKHYIYFGSDKMPECFDLEGCCKLLQACTLRFSESGKKDYETTGSFVEEHEDVYCAFCHSKLERGRYFAFDKRRYICMNCAITTCGEDSALQEQLAKVRAYWKERFPSVDIPANMTAKHDRVRNVRTEPFTSEQSYRVDMANRTILVERDEPISNTYTALLLGLIHAWQQENKLLIPEMMGQLYYEEIESLKVRGLETQANWIYENLDVAVKGYVDAIVAFIAEAEGNNSFLYLMQIAASRVDDTPVGDDEPVGLFDPDRIPRFWKRYLKGEHASGSVDQIPDDATLDESEVGEDETADEAEKGKKKPARKRVSGFKSGAKLVPYEAEEATNPELRLYNELARRAADFNDEPIFVPGMSDETISRVFYHMRGDYPEFFWLSGYCHGTQGGKKFVSHSFRCLGADGKIDLKQVKEKRTALRKAAKPFVQGITGKMKPYEALLTIYRRLILTLDYDGIGLDASRGRESDERQDDNLRSLYSALVDHKVVCAGYAVAMQYLLQMVGIPCADVTSESNKDGCHAFNIVKLGDECYYLDATWGDASNTKHQNYKDRVDYDYCCVPLSEFQLTSADSVAFHTPRHAFYPNLEEFTAKRYEYFRYHGAYLDRFDEEKLVEIFVNAALNYDEKEMGKFAVAFRCCNEDTLRLVMSQLTSKGKLWPILKTAAERVKAKNRKAAKLLETEGYSYSTHSNSHTAYFYMS